MNYSQFDSTLQVVGTEVKKLSKAFQQLYRLHKRGYWRKLEVLYRETSFNLEYIQSMMSHLEKNEQYAPDIDLYNEYKKEVNTFVKDAQSVLAMYKEEREKGGNCK